MYDNVVCKYKLPRYTCAASSVFRTTVSRKADQRDSAESHKTLLIWFLNHFKSDWVQASKPTSPACSEQQTLLCPMCKRLSFFISSNTAELWQPSFCSLLVILMSLLTAHTAETPSKHVGTYGKYSFLECHWQSLQANKETRAQSQAFMKHPTNLTTFSITHWKAFLAFGFSLCEVT